MKSRWSVSDDLTLSLLSTLESVHCSQGPFLLKYINQHGVPLEAVPLILWRTDKYKKKDKRKV